MKHLLALFLLFVVMVLPRDLFADNMHFTNGYNYTYTKNNISHTYFPIAWDLRGAHHNMKYYYYLYGGYDLNTTAPRMASQFMVPLYEEMNDAGINTVIVRTEPMLDGASQNGYTRTMRIVVDVINAGFNVILGGMTNSGGSVNAKEMTDNRFVYETIWTNMYYSFGTINGNSLVGYDGFDEPDNFAYELYPDVYGVTQRLDDPVLPNISLPFGGMICQHTDKSEWPDGDPYLGTTPFPAEDVYSLPYNFGRAMDYLRIDFYQERTYTWEEEVSVTPPEPSGTSVVARGFADLWPSESIFRNAYASKDEYYVVADATGNLLFRLYENIGCDEVDEAPLFQYKACIGLGLQAVGDVRVSQSDCRSTDVGERQGGDPELNGGVAVWKYNEPISSARFIQYRADAGLEVCEFQTNIDDQTYVSRNITIGEVDYRTLDGSPRGVCTGLIGSSQTRVLWYGAPSGPGPLPNRWIAQVFRNNQEGELVPSPTEDLINSTIELPEGFYPDGAVWGYFWTTANWTKRVSGFVLYDSDGSYVVISTEPESEEEWMCSPLNENSLWSSYNGNATAVTVYRYTSPYYMVPHNDIIVAVISMPNSGNDRLWLSDYQSSDNNFPAINEYRCVEIDDDFNPDDVSIFSMSEVNVGISCFDGNTNSRRFITHNESSLFKFPDLVQNACYEYSDNFAGRTSIGECRTHHTRQTGCDVAWSETSADVTSLCFQGGNMNNIYPQQMFRNTCSPSTYGGGSGGPGVYDIYHEIAIRRSDTRANCLIANVHAQGRGAQTASYVPSHEEMLYSCLGPVVHGVRGLSYYGLDLALMSGTVANGGQGYVIGRYPGEIHGWGPSIDGSQPVDAVSVVHWFTRRFTGRFEPVSGFNYEHVPDFSNVLVDPSAELFLDVETVTQVNSRDYSRVAERSVSPVASDSDNLIAYVSDAAGNRISDPILNFVAYQLANDDIVIYLSYDGSSAHTRYICLKGKNYSLPDGEFGGYLDVFDNMYHTGVITVGKPPRYIVEVPWYPIHNATILWLPDGNSPENEVTRREQHCDLASLARIEINRSVGAHISIEAVGLDAGVYDITGRCLEVIPSGGETTLSVSSHPCGVYFIVQRPEEGGLRTERVLLVNQDAID